ncbi:hypothetical protein Q669_29200 [Labrenzia sp. C1B10]|uniref:hypothetical protein n=1 Tax=unclassified Labrenzia TaxID=2648686 RepID=UPI0003B91079|nr:MULTISPECIES: hypothetical protein [unclassified Labrenzia]ERP95964.1 hypothetical protein Q669_29200 [Labrenzia sp. C1B10]ERS09546.1 hypothetical protein Q675_00010 [Labrenzia sp. C1B70]
MIEGYSTSGETVKTLRIDHQELYSMEVTLTGLFIVVGLAYVLIKGRNEEISRYRNRVEDLEQLNQYRECELNAYHFHYGFLSGEQLDEYEASRSKGNFTNNS